MSFKSRNHERGSVIFYILIAVVLFAALGFAVSKMMRGGIGESVGKETGKVFVSEVLTYAQTLRQGISLIQISGGCTPEKISFERNPFDGSDPLYTNASASGLSCHVFHPEGAGLSYQTGFDGQDWRFTSAFAVESLGGDGQEIVAALRVQKSVCAVLNSQLGIADNALAVPMNDEADLKNILPPYDGIFGVNGVLTGAYAGKMAGCYKSTHAATGAEYTFYQVLMPR